MFFNIKKVCFILFIKKIQKHTTLNFKLNFKLFNCIKGS